MGFSTPSYGLADLIARIDRGDIQIPDFQRAYQWDEDRIRALLVTVLRGYPMGSLLALDTRNEPMRFRPRPLAGAPDTGRDPGLLLLDGQQRLTSLYLALRGGDTAAEADTAAGAHTGIPGHVPTRDFRGKAVTRRYFVDVAKVVEEDILPDESVFATDESGRVTSHFGPVLDEPLDTPEAARRAGCIPVAALLSEAGAAHLFAMAGEEDSAVLAAFNNRVLRTVAAYATPMIRLGRETMNAGVGTIFAQANSLGLQMDVVDLLTAVFASEDPDFHLAEDWRGIAKHLHAYPALRGIDRHSFLSAVALYVTANKGNPNPGGQREDIVQLTLVEYRDAAAVLRVTFREVGEFLAQRHIIAAEQVPYPKQIVPLAVILARLAQMPGALSTQASWDKINQWFWCGVFGELYGSSSVSLRAARDVREVVDWVAGNAETVPQTVRDAQFAESRLLSAREDSAIFRAIFALLMARGAQDWRTAKGFDKETVDQLQPGFHRIFPAAWCARHRVDEVLAGSVLNRTPMGKRTEVVTDGYGPDRYLARVQAKSLMDDSEFDAVLASHNLDAQLLHKARFAEFLADRRRRFVGMVEHAMGKEVYRDVDEENYAAGVEGPEAFSR